MLAGENQLDINFLIMITTLVILTEDLDFKRVDITLDKSQISGFSVIRGKIWGMKKEMQIIFYSNLLFGN